MPLHLGPRVYSVCCHVCIQICRPVHHNNYNNHCNNKKNHNNKNNYINNYTNNNKIISSSETICIIIVLLRKNTIRSDANEENVSSHQRSSRDRPTTSLTASWRRRKPITAEEMIDVGWKCHGLSLLGLIRPAFDQPLRPPPLFITPD